MPINLVIPVCGQPELLKQLVTTTSRQHKPGEVQFFIVDNGSDAATCDYLRGLAIGEDFHIVYMGSNHGFAAACNAGIDAVKDHYARVGSGHPGPVCFLNSDTFPVARAFDMLARTLDENPDFAAVGPVSNNVSGPQCVEFPLALSAKSEIERWLQYQYKDSGILETDRLVGFCLMVRDRVWQKFRFDERYGIGNFEDDDYCQQLLAAGFHLAIETRAFVYHVGSATFQALGITGGRFSELMARNEAYFKRKWAADEASTAQGDLEFRQEDWQSGRATTKAPGIPSSGPPSGPPPKFTRVKGIVIGIPNHKGSIPYMTAQSLMAVSAAIARAGLPCSVKIIPCAALHEARQNVVNAILDAPPEFTHAIFLDDDMVFGPDAVANLIADADHHDLDFVTNVAFVNGLPTGPNIFGLRDDRPEFGHAPWWDMMTQWPRNELFEIAACGMANCLVSRRMLKKMREGRSETWCHFIYGELRSEDVAFCINARKAGFKLYCDSRAIVGHISREVKVIDIRDYDQQAGADGMRLKDPELPVGVCKGRGPYVEYVPRSTRWASKPADFLNCAEGVPGQTLLMGD